MKKIIIAVLAVAAMVACSKEQTVVAPKGDAIGFSTFVDNATRADDITTGNLEEFGVYASIENTSGAALILSNAKVYLNSDNAWTYDNTQYWVPKAMYEFTAFAPHTGAKWTYAPSTTADEGDVTFDNKTAKADQDFIFAAADMNLTTTEALTASPGVVNFTFAHQLSKVAFKFNNDFATENNITLRVYNVNVAGLVSKATATVAEGAAGVWTKTTDSDTFARTFGTQVAANAENTATIIAAKSNIVTDYHYFIPVAETQYTVTFDVDIFQAGVMIDTYHHTVNTKPTLAKGGNYLFTTTLNASNVSDDPTQQLYPIEFNVNNVNGWNPAEDGTGVVIK